MAMAAGQAMTRRALWVPSKVLALPQTVGLPEADEKPVNFRGCWTHRLNWTFVTHARITILQQYQYIYLLKQQLLDNEAVDA